MKSEFHTKVVKEINSSTYSKAFLLGAYFSIKLFRFSKSVVCLNDTK